MIPFIRVKYDVQWLDSVQVARKTWDNLEGGFNLANLAYHLDIEFRHHDALEDAVACGKILTMACNKHACEVSRWFCI